MNYKKIKTKLNKFAFVNNAYENYRYDKVGF